MRIAACLWHDRLGAKQAVVPQASNKLANTSHLMLRCCPCLPACRFWPVRKYPWGKAEALSSQHSDLAALRVSGAVWLGSCRPCMHGCGFAAFCLICWLLPRLLDNQPALSQMYSTSACCIWVPVRTFRPGAASPLSQVPYAHGGPHPLSSALHRRTWPGRQKLLCHHAAHCLLRFFTFCPAETAVRGQLL